MKILETERLIVREVDDSDAAFLRDVVNIPEFIKYVGDRGVKTMDDALKYAGKITDHYAEHGYGIWVVEIKETGEKAGLCGLLKRDHLDAPDIGFSFLPAFWSKGYAYESAIATMEYGRDRLGIKKILAITSEDNTSSIKLIEKLGLRFDSMTRMPDEDHDVRLFASHDLR